MSNEYYIELDDESNNSEKITLPSEQEKLVKRKKPKKSSIKKRDRTRIKWGTIILFIILIYLFYTPILNWIMGILQLNPTIHKLYLNIYAEIANNTLKGLFFVAILGSLFFLALPSEALFVYFLGSTEFPFFLIIPFMVLGNVAGLIFNYVIGLLLGERTVKWLFRKNYEKYKTKINEYGGMVLFFGNIFPGPIEVLTLFYGSFKFPPLRYVYLCMMGRLFKYLILFFIYLLFWEQLIGFYDIAITDLQTIKTLYTFK